MSIHHRGWRVQAPLSLATLCTVFLAAASVAPAWRTAGAQRGVPADTDYAPVVARVQSAIEREMRVHGLPAVSVALVDDQRIVWSRGFGFARPSDSTPATAETIYRVGSVSKLFTDIAVMQLVERGKLNLDTSVAAYLPDFHPRNPYGGVITLRQLMAHRSGLVREPPLGSYFDSTPPSLAATVRSLNATTLVYPPGAHTKYSNAGIATVGEVLERTQGQPFATYLAAAVLRPLGMAHSGFEPAPELVRGLATGYMWTLDGRSFAAPTFQLGIAPAGSMYTSVADLGRFLSALFAGGVGEHGRVLRAETLGEMWTQQFARAESPAGYGLGFRIGLLDGRRTIGHDGAIYGFATTLQALPDDKLGVVVITTLDGANASVDRIAQVALRAMRDRQARPSAGPAIVVAGTPASGAMRGEAEVGPLETDSITAERAHLLPGRYAAAAGGAREVELQHRAGGLAVSSAAGGGAPELRARGDTLVVDDVVFASDERFLPNADSATALVTMRPSTPGDTLARLPDPEPAAAPERWRGLIGEYGPDYDVLYVYERAGSLWAQIEWFFPYPLAEITRDTFAFPPAGLYDGETLVFTRDRSGRATGVRAAGVRFPRRNIEPRAGTNQLRITPQRPIPALRREALAATPPAESGSFKTPDLVELTTLDSTIHLEVRYATTNNFLGARMYEEGRAFLQRPAAEAVVRASRVLHALGYGLLIHDAYRPWYVTKIFWDATPPAKKWLVADPSQGSRHNRGAAVDLTLYDLKTGRPVDMVSTYDESTDRAYPDYPGGTSRQRWHRQLLRQVMEAQGFTVYAQEWWHFDYHDWRSYPILNEPFNRIGRTQRDH